MGEAFQAAGCQTFYAGKWHLGGKRFLPTDQGFDEYVGDSDDEEPCGQGTVSLFTALDLATGNVLGEWFR